MAESLCSLLRCCLLSVLSSVILVPSVQASLLVASSKDGLQATFEQVPLAAYDLIESNIHQRQDYDLVGAEIIMRTGPNNRPVHGERWGVKFFEVTTNTLLSDLFWVYDSFSDCIYNTYGSVSACGLKTNPFYKRYVAYLYARCYPRVNNETGQDYEYKTVVSHDVADLSTYNYKPTEFVPRVNNNVDYAIALQPHIPGVQPAQTTPIHVIVEDDRGCGKLLRDVKVTLTNTIQAHSRGHEHFIGNEPGDGRYAVVAPWDGTVKSFRPDNKTALEDGTTNKDGLFVTQYTSGELSVDETFVIETKNRENKPGKPLDKPILIRLPGLEALPAQGLGYVIVKSDHHGYHHVYVQPNVAGPILTLPEAFAEEVKKSLGPQAPATLPDLVFTGMSLSHGGLFDYRGTRRPPHNSHRHGIDADLDHDLISSHLRDELAVAIRKRQKFTMSVPTERPEYPQATHWHLRHGG